MKLAIALQIYNGDAWIGLRLVKLICSFEKFRDDIEFIVSARRGTNPDVVADIVKVASTKFKSVSVIKGKRFGDGWPLGPNDLWAETMMRVSQLHGAGKIKSSGVLTVESDCIPLRPGWLDALADEWSVASKSHECLGHAHGDPPTHINGNAIFACDVTIKHPELNGSDSRSGWDAYHGKLLLQIGKDTPLIYQRYRITEITRAEVEAIRKDGQIPALFHGIKKGIGIEIIEEMIADGSFFKR